MERRLSLGIDLGSNSLGTALIDPDKGEIVFAGVRVFQAGVEGDLETGREQSRAAARREKRLQRRQTDRRRRRLNNVFKILQSMGLLPPGERGAVLPALDATLRARFPETEILPYFLRARALDHPLESHELGRAFFHLAQRRGFESNRAAPAKETEEERGKVKSGIRDLKDQIHASGKRTLGEFLASLNPHEARIRGRYTHRSMYKNEFEQIWASQSRWHPSVLSPAAKDRLWRAMFHQRPLKDVSRMVGVCELEKGEKRAPLRTLEAQRLRVLGFVNNLRIRQRDLSERPLTPAERTLLLEECQRRTSLKFTEVRKILNLGKLTFTIEDGGEKNVPCNLTAARLREALGESWDALTPAQQADLVEDVGDGKRCPTDEDVARCAREKWGFDEAAAARLAEVRLPDDYSRFSLTALRRLLPHLEAGLSVEQAIRIEYPESRETSDPLPLLPPVRDVLPEIRNPAVLRSLTELRKTVNAIIRRYGKPDTIRVELARDLKRSRKEREREANRNRERQKLRDIAAEELRKHDSVRFAQPKPSDIEKAMLALEAGWRCPYTGEHYCFTDVFGDHPKVDVEHIIPESRSLDNSFVNKTLAYRQANIEKGRRTPREWLAESDPERYERMVDIVKKFDKRFDVAGKLKRFTMEPTELQALLQEFTERQLQETRYASKLAARYLGLLYGGVVDQDGRRRVFACAGAVTAKLRSAWDLNRILSDQPEKSRDDHRHHAIDAIAVALTDESSVQALARAAEEAETRHRRRLIVPFPWDGFGVEVRNVIANLNVSHRPLRRLSGSLHEETLYSREREGPGGRKVVHFRVPVTKLASPKDAQDIVDASVRAAVIAKIEELGGGGNKLQDNWPHLLTRKGKLIPIRRVRIRKSQSVVPLGSAANPRHVIPGSNHHMEIVADLDIHGQPNRYRGIAVSMLEAVERKRQGLPVVQRDHGPGRRFICSLSEGDMIQARREPHDQACIWKVRGVRANGTVILSPATDARKKDAIAADRKIWDTSVNTVFSRDPARKVLVTHLGEVQPAND